MKVKFTKTSDMIKYNGSFNAVDGQVCEVLGVEAERLCKDFPKNFVVVGLDTVIETEPEKSVQPKSNKMIGERKNK